MKILMLTTSFDIGGAETHILELSKALREKGEGGENEDGKKEVAERKSFRGRGRGGSDL